jgi:hypothetical protein
VTGAASRRKGATYENAVVNWLKANGWPFAERRIAGMSDDRGDILLPGVVVECKNRKSIDLAGFVDQLEDEIATSGAPTGLCVVKRAGVADVGRHYAVTTVARAFEWLR